MNIFICLEGSNPLPNYVLCKYLLEERRLDKNELPIPDKIIFISSNDTQKFAQNIVLKLKLNHNREKFEHILLDDEERDGEIIVKKVTEALNRIMDNENIESIHINFTGGTKPMAVYSYNTAKEYARRASVTFISSDLSPKKYIIKANIDDKYTSPFPTQSDLRDRVEITLKDVIYLHSMEFHSGLNNKRIEIDLEKFKTDIYKELSTEKRKECPMLKGIPEMQKTLKITKDKNNKEGANEISRYLKDLKSRLSHYNYIASTKYTNSEKHKADELEKLVGFIDGKWLEDYLFESIKEIEKECKLSTVKLSVEGKSKLDRNKRCEIDVIAMRGYQMFLFSCTTSTSIKTIKGKAFEVMYRANQLGGGHAKAIVAHLMPEKQVPQNKYFEENNNKKLVADLDSFNATENIYTITGDDISNKDKLKEALKKIFLR